MVPRELLLYKLLLSNVDGKFYNSIKSIYTGTESQVRVNGLHTDFFDVATGVRQGDVLSPLLFNFYTSDLITELNNWVRSSNFMFQFGESNFEYVSIICK